MTNATSPPLTQELQAALDRDPLELAGELADALAILDQCAARNIKPDEEFLNLIDALLTEIDLMQLFGIIHAA